MSIRLIKGALLASALALPAGVAWAQDDDRAILTAVPQQLTAWVENYNPFNSTTVLPTIVDFMYEPLVIFNAMQGGEAEYRLAESYEYSEDLLSLTFTLREGLTWSDGEPITAEDVVFTFDLINEFPALDIRAVWPKLAGVEAVDERTVRIDMTEVDAGLIYQLVQVYPVPEHIWADVEDPVTYTNPETVGSGPLTEIDRFTPQEYIQCRNPNYWDAESLHVDCMRLPQLANNDQVLSAAANGELDWFGSFLPDIERTYVGTDPDNHGYWFPSGSPVYLSLNLDTDDAGLSEAFNDVAFRRAVSMAMDREAMVDIAGYGYPTVNDYPSGLGRAYHSWNNPEVEAQYGQFTEFDIEGARALLEEGGYADGNGDGFVESPSGDPIAFDIIVPNGWTDWVNTVQLAVEGLNELGINATMQTPESPAWTDQLIAGDYQAALNSVTTGVSPHYFLDQALHSRHIGQSRFQSARYSNPALDEALDAFNTTVDPDEQAQYMNEIQMLIAEDMPLIFVFDNPLWYEYNTARFTGFFNADNPQARPVVYSGVPERLLHLLALRPVE